MNISRSLNGLCLPQRGCCAALGLFDGVHTGHQAVLETAVSWARRLGVMPLVFTFSPGGHIPEAKRGMTRLMSGDMLCRVFEDMGVLYMAAPDFSEIRGLSPSAFVNGVLAGRLGAAHVVCGYNFRFGENASGGADTLKRLCEAAGISAEIIPAVEIGGKPVSSSRIRALISQGDVLSANRLLGRPFTIDFEVAGERHLKGAPGCTAICQPFPGDFTVPRRGVYATLAHTGGEIRKGVTGVGLESAIISGGAAAETYIQGFEGGMCGRRIRIEFLRFLRPEGNSASPEEPETRFEAEIKKLCS